MGSVTAVVVSANGMLLASGSTDGTVRTWDMRTGVADHLLTGHVGPINALIFTPDSTRLISGGRDGTFRTWNVDSGILEHAGRVSSPIYSLAITADGSSLIAGGADGMAHVWDRLTGDRRLILTHDGRVYAVAVSPDERHIISGSFDGSVRTWDAADGNSQLTIRHGSPVFATVATPDGRYLVSGGGGGGGRNDQGQGTVRIWDANSGRLIRTLTGHTDIVRRLVITPDGRTLISSSNDRTIRLWNVHTGALQRTLTGHDAAPSLGVTPDSQTLISGDLDGTLRVWDIATGTQRRNIDPADKSPRGQLADPLSDEPTEEDLLDVGPEVSRMATLVASAGTSAPLSIALLADWGAGKSSFMAQMQKEIDRLSGSSREDPRASPYLSRIHQIRFNAWHYSDDHVWAGIVETLFEELVKDPYTPTPDPAAATIKRVAIQDELVQNQDEQRKLSATLRSIDTVSRGQGHLAGVSSPFSVFRTYWAAASHVYQDARRSWRTLAVLLSVFVVAAVVSLTLGTQLAALGFWLIALGSTTIFTLSTGLWKTYQLINKRSGVLRDRMDDRLKSLHHREVDLRHDLAQVDAVKALSQFVQDRAESGEYSEYRGIVGHVHGHLGQLDRHIREAGHLWAEDPKGSPPIQRIVLYIDDLDRCPPNRVVDVLAAVHLLLALPLFIVVVGVDSRWLRRSLHHHDQNLFSQIGKTADTSDFNDPMDYLDKIFQIPFALRSMNQNSARNFIRRLVPDGEPDERALVGDPASPQNPSPSDDLDRTESRASGISESTEPQSPPDVARVLQPKSLSLRTHERDFLAELGAFTGTPRAAKKLVNLYRLVRIGVAPSELTTFAGSATSEPYRAAGLLLALVVGSPTLATSVLMTILDAGPDSDLLNTLRAASTHDKHSDQSAPPEQYCSTCAGWENTLNTVQAVSRGNPGLPSAINSYQMWAPEIARFSFHTRPLWARLSPNQQAAAAQPRLADSETTEVDTNS